MDFYAFEEKLNYISRLPLAEANLFDPIAYAQIKKAVEGLIC